MLVNEDQIESLITLSREFLYDFTTKKYGYLQLSRTKGDYRTFFSANVCKYAVSELTASYRITETSTICESSGNSSVVLAFEPERETQHASRHIFRDILYSGSDIFVDPELAVLVDPNVDLNKELLRLYEKLKEYPFYLQLALIWYCNYFGVEYQTPVLDTTPGCVVYGKEYYKELVESNRYTEWVSSTLKAVAATF